MVVCRAIEDIIVYIFTSYFFSSTLNSIFFFFLFLDRGVIVGWDARCRASGSWISSTGVARLPHGTEQRFYRAVVDARDRPGAQVSYVAEDNIVPICGSEAEHIVLHPASTLLVHRYQQQSSLDSGSDDESDSSTKRAESY
jgi:hemimethylated DNA binding protein